MERLSVSPCQIHCSLVCGTVDYDAREFQKRVETVEKYRGRNKSAQQHAFDIIYFFVLHVDWLLSIAIRYY